MRSFFPRPCARLQSERRRHRLPAGEAAIRSRGALRSQAAPRPPSKPTTFQALAHPCGDGRLTQLEEATWVPGRAGPRSETSAAVRATSTAATLATTGATAAAFRIAGVLVGNTRDGARTFLTTSAAAAFRIIRVFIGEAGSAARTLLTATAAAA